MDSKGIATIDFIFTIFLMILIGIISLNFIGNSLENSKVNEEDLNMRSIVDKVANTINQVNSNNIGHSQEFTLPNNISKNSYYLIIKQNDVQLLCKNKKTGSLIIQIKLANFNGELINEIRLYSGESYKIKKSLDENNLTMIQIYKI